MRQIIVSITNFKEDIRAVTALEYAILAGLVSLGIAAMFTSWGEALADKLTSALG